MCPGRKLCTNASNCSIRGCLPLRWWASAFEQTACVLLCIRFSVNCCFAAGRRIGSAHYFPRPTRFSIHRLADVDGCSDVWHCRWQTSQDFIRDASEAIWLIYFVPNSIITTRGSIIVWNRKSFWNRETSPETCDNGRDEFFCILFYVIRNLRLHRRMLCFPRWSERPVHR